MTFLHRLMVMDPASREGAQIRPYLLRFGIIPEPISTQHRFRGT
jgi:hypothetical protein